MSVDVSRLPELIRARGDPIIPELDFSLIRDSEVSEATKPDRLVYVFDGGGQHGRHALPYTILSRIERGGRTP